jgi:hypothetical protein
MGVFEGIDASSAGCLVCTELQRIFRGKSHAQLFGGGAGGAGGGNGEGAAGNETGGGGAEEEAEEKATTSVSARAKLVRGFNSVKRNLRTLIMSRDDGGAEERAYAIATAAAAGGRGEVSADELNVVAAALRTRQRKPLYVSPDLQPEVPQFDADTAAAITRAVQEFAATPKKKFDQYGWLLPAPAPALTPAQFASLVLYADLLDPGFTPHAVVGLHKLNPVYP